MCLLAASSRITANLIGKQSDTARRHAKSCASNGGEILFQPGRPGRRQRACDKCSKARRSCDGAQPCSKCHLRNIPCSYERRDNGHNRASDSQRARAATLDGRTSDTSLELLLRITNPNACGPRDAIVAVCFNNDIDEVYMPNDLGFPDVVIGDFEESFVYHSELFDFNVGFEAGPDPWPHIGYMTSDSTSLKACMRDIVQQLSSMHELTRNRCETEVGDFNLALAESVFTVQNLQHFVWAYFTYVQPYLPMIHKPTFRMEECSSVLLLAIFVLGSKFCGPLDQAILVREFEGVAEEFVFSERIFKDYSRMGNREDLQITRADIESLQAAVIMEALLLSLNDGSALVRLRTERHPRVVAVLRAFGLLELTCASAAVGHRSWEDFVEREVMIR